MRSAAALLSLCLAVSGCANMRNLRLESQFDGTKLSGKLNTQTHVMEVGLEQEPYNGKAVEVSAADPAAAPPGARYYVARLKAFSNRSMRCEFNLLPQGGGKGVCYTGTIAYTLLIE